MKNQTTLWAILTVTMVLIALLFGLRPKAWHLTNDVQVLSEMRGIRFGGAGIAYVDDLHAIGLSGHTGPLTIEMAVTPANIYKKGFSPLLVMHDGGERHQLAIWQYGASIIVMNGNDFAYRRREPRIAARDVMSPRQTLYLTITSGEQGTHMYVNGELATFDRNLKLSIPGGGDNLWLVLGNSVHGKHGWSGALHGVALSAEAMRADAVSRRFEDWSADRNFDFLMQEAQELLFTFKAKTGRAFADASGGDHHLEVPAFMIALQKTFLTMPVNVLNWNRSTVGDMLVNLVGFMPMGIVFYGLLQCFPGPLARHNLLFAVAFCMLLSLGIELTQAWIPTRVSSLPDWTLNTLGAWLGIVLWRLVFRRKTV